MKLKISKFKQYKNSSGTLVPFLLNSLFKNFKLKRFFFIKCKKFSKRAYHAHKFCSQVYVPILGIASVTVINKKNKIKKLLLSETNRKILLVPKLHWTEIIFKSKFNILLVLCDYNYDRSEYIECKKTFLNS